MIKRYMILTDRRLDREIRRILGLQGEAGAAHAPDGEADIVIVSSAVLARYNRREAHKLRALREGRQLLVVVTEQTITKTVEAIQMADGVVFQDENLQNLPKIVALMEERHFSVPAGTLSVIMERGLRRNILLALSPSERRLLDLLGHGCSNGAIARTLDISEGRTKYLIRALLKKLLLRNRTQAAVFATRETQLAGGLSDPPGLSNGGLSNGRTGD